MLLQESTEKSMLGHDHADLAMFASEKARLRTALGTDRGGGRRGCFRTDFLRHLNPFLFASTLIHFPCFAGSRPLACEERWRTPDRPDREERRATK